jgi:hypothetical protein
MGPTRQNGTAALTTPNRFMRVASHCRLSEAELINCLLLTNLRTDVWFRGPRCTGESSCPVVSALHTFSEETRRQGKMLAIFDEDLFVLIASSTRSRKDSVTRSVFSGPRAGRFRNRRPSREVSPPRQDLCAPGIYVHIICLKTGVLVGFVSQKPTRKTPTCCLAVVLLQGWKN